MRVRPDRTSALAVQALFSGSQIVAHCARFCEELYLTDPFLTQSMMAAAFRGSVADMCSYLATEFDIAQRHGAAIAAMSAPAGADADAGPELPASWILPIVQFFSELISRVETQEDDTLLETLEHATDMASALVDVMDVESLADVFEAGMGQAAVISAEQAISRLAPRAHAAVDPLGVAFAPMADAVAKLGRRTPVGAKLSSAEWARVPLALRERAQFSAYVESVRFLATIQEKIGKRLAMEREALANGKHAFVDRDSFIRDMRKLADELGIRTTDAAGRGTVRDIRSVRRLGLIYDMQVSMAEGYARWKIDNDADVLDEFPAYRLSGSTAERPRAEALWRGRWAEAGAEVGWAGALQGDLVALKTSPIWMSLSRFGTPWPPFDFGSTRILDDVDRSEAEALGLLDTGSPVPEFEGGSGRAFDGETGEPIGFNRALEASVSGWRPDQVSTLQLAFGDQVQHRDSKVQWQGNLIRDYVERALRERSWNGKAVSLGLATQDAIAKAASVKDLAGYHLKIDPGHVRKTWRDHGPRNGYEDGSGEKRDGHVPLAKVDYELIPELWRRPDEVRSGDEPDDVVFVKRILGRLVGATWTVSQGHTLMLKTLYKWQ